MISSWYTRDSNLALFNHMASEIGKKRSHWQPRGVRISLPPAATALPDEWKRLLEWLPEKLYEC